MWTFARAREEGEYQTDGQGSRLFSDRLRAVCEKRAAAAASIEDCPSSPPLAEPSSHEEQQQQFDDASHPSVHPSIVLLNSPSASAHRSAREKESSSSTTSPLSALSSRGKKRPDHPDPFIAGYGYVGSYPFYHFPTFSSNMTDAGSCARDNQGVNGAGGDTDASAEAEVVVDAAGEAADRVNLNLVEPPFQYCIPFIPLPLFPHTHALSLIRFRFDPSRPRPGLYVLYVDRLLLLPASLLLLLLLLLLPAPALAPVPALACKLA